MCRAVWQYNTNLFTTEAFSRRLEVHLNPQILAPYHITGLVVKTSPPASDAPPLPIVAIVAGTGRAPLSLPLSLRHKPMECEPLQREREFSVDNLLVLIHFIIEMILVVRPCAMGV